MERNRQLKGVCTAWSWCQSNFLWLLHFYSIHLVCYTFNTVINISPLKQTKHDTMTKTTSCPTNFLLNPPGASQCQVSTQSLIISTGLDVNEADEDKNEALLRAVVLLETSKGAVEFLSVTPSSPALTTSKPRFRRKNSFFSF